jgi:hypothetical protein
LYFSDIKSKKIWYVKVKNWVCGIDDKPQKKLTFEEKQLIKKKMTDIRENRRAKIVTSVAAIIVAIGTTFLLAFFY